jgi:hypothetical protein
MTQTIDPAPVGDGATIVPIDALRQRRRLDYLLDLRSTLAVLSAERSAHELDDASETLGQQYAVEHAIDQEFPDVYAARFPAWARYDAELAHSPDRLSRDCGICQAIARTHGVNLTPPEAA